MCCFSLPVKSVSETRIFARPAAEGRQFLAYSMTIEAAQELAMVLPLPVKPESGEHVVNFINLKEYENFFDDLESGFPKPPPPPSERATFTSLGPVPATAAILDVMQVGDFEASFVPRVKDFARLDKRFRLPAGTWEKLPAYRDYGFAVFKLKSGKLRVHPMAFAFPRRDADTLFFPTVHIHDGHVHNKADFDHVLYAQPSGETQLRLDEWTES